VVERHAFLLDLLRLPTERLEAPPPLLTLRRPVCDLLLQLPQSAKLELPLPLLRERDL